MSSSLAFAAAEREASCALSLDRLQAVRIEAEQLEDGRRDLRGLDRSVVEASGVNRAATHQDRHVAVVRIVAAVLRNLRSAGVDGSDLGDADHVRHAAVTEWDADEIGGILSRIDGRIAGLGV